MLQKRSTSRLAVRGGAALGVGVALLAGAFPGAVGADEDHDNYVPGNPTCEDLGYENGFKIEATGELPDSGTYTVGDPGTEGQGDAGNFEVTIDVTAGDPATVDFVANTPVGAVYVKAGPGGLLYEYDPAVTSDEGLESKKDSISHITFCWDGDTPPPDGEEPGPTTTVPVDGEEPGVTTTVPADGEEPPSDAPPAAEPVTGEPTFTG